MNTFTEENYLKAIYKLSEKFPGDISTNAIAERLSTKAGTVTDMLKKLSEKKLLNYQKYQGVSLTEQGKAIAINIIRKHRLWECFLVDKLEFNWDEIHHIAEELEHINSEELINRLDKFLGHPVYDPHGDPIPDSNGNFSSRKALLLCDLQGNTASIMTGVVDHSPIFLQYLDKMQIKLGGEVEIQEIFDFDQSLTILFSGRIMQISHDVAKNILVSIK